eukprot:CAMPEP_0194053576 /NCGR_PEP_ID=MMETSP0009_2-20130614/50471_1 /TAXON_ID=210454 /ORGANISM="Grammatophora oceanica, Strain CCMP 410" /LENGTH=37 /DNA_ID= /DNA_START= /DNA_END= /DNA_ORIENTATION=
MALLLFCLLVHGDDSCVFSPRSSTNDPLGLETKTRRE